MGTSKQHGFTIIEVMLFLGISGLLIVMLLVGAGSSLNNQRYKDAVQSFKSLVQAQYTELSTIRNDRDNTWTCDANAVVTQGGTTTQYRGQGDCVLVGKYMRIDKDDIRLYTVLANPKPTQTLGLDDIASLTTNYYLTVSTTNIEQDSLDWGTAIAWPVSGANAKPAGTSRTMGIFFARSPDSGSIYTFTSDDIPAIPNSIPQTTLTDMIKPGLQIPGQSSRTICVVSNGLTKTGDTAVYIDAYAASTSSIETRSNDFMLSQPGAPQC